MENQSVLSPLMDRMAKMVVNIGKPKVSSQAKNTAAALQTVSQPLGLEDSSFSTPEQTLGHIFQLMVENDGMREMDHIDDLKRLDQKNRDEQSRHKEILKALTIRRPPKPKKVKVEKPKEKPKKKVEEPTPPTPPAPSPTAPTPTPTTPPVVPPKAPPTTTPPVTPPKTATPTSPTLPSVPTAVKVGAGALGGAAFVGMAASNIAKEESLPKGGKAYWDPNDQRTLVSIGYGHQIKENEYKQGYIDINGDKVSLVGDRGIDTKLNTEQAKKLLEIDVPKYEKTAREPLGSSWNKLTDEQKSALITYSYNVGSTRSLVNAGIKDAIDSGNMELAAKIIAEKGIKTANGKYSEVLDKRRRREADLFASGIKKNSLPNNNPASAVDSLSNQNKNLRDSLKPNDASTVVNNTSINTQSSPPQGSNSPAVNDKSAMENKKNNK